MQTFIKFTTINGLPLFLHSRLLSSVVSVREFPQSHVIAHTEITILQGMKAITYCVKEDAATVMQTIESAILRTKRKTLFRPPLPWGSFVSSVKKFVRSCLTDNVIVTASVVLSVIALLLAVASL